MSLAATTKDHTVFCMRDDYTLHEYLRSV